MSSSDKVVPLRTYPGGAAAGMRMALDNGRIEIVTAGPNSEFGFIKSDPYKTDAGTGLVVPAAPSNSIGNARYLLMLARYSFGTGEQSASLKGARLIGIRQYAELVARVPGRTTPLGTGSGPPTDSTVVLRKEIVSPLWHPPDGNISWHVMFEPPMRRDTRNPANTDGIRYQDSDSPALLYQTLGPYVPPNGGRPWGKPLGASLGNMHDLRYRWRDQYSEYALDIPIPTPCTVSLYASVRQNDPALNPVLADTTLTQVFTALCPEDQFLMAFAAFAKYGVVAGSLVFNQNMGEDVP